MDSGASPHLTANKNNITNPMPYQGQETIMLGNGHTIPSTHFGTRLLFTGNMTFKSQNILYATHLAKNLISVRQLCQNNNVSIQFYPSHFCVKDLDKDITMLMGRVESGLYKLPRRDWKNHRSPTGKC